MRTLIFTGNASNGIVLASAATAWMSAQNGKRTLLASIGPSHSLSVLPGVSETDTPQNIAPNLHVWEFNVLDRMSQFLEKLRPRLFGILTQLSGDELPTLPGFDLLFGLEYLVQQAAPEYDMVVVDAGQHDALLRALSVPDGFRWLLRLIFGLDRGPGRSTESLNNAIISANLLPFEWIGRIQDVRVTLEKLRDDMVGPPRTTARYVLRPDSAALNEARLALPTLQLHGLAVDSVIAGPIMPADVSDTMLRAIAHQQQEIVNESKTIWKSLPMFHLPMTVPVTGMDELVALGKELYGDRSPTETYDVSPPIEINNDERFIAFRLPGLNRGALNLTLTYDELVVRAGPYRRHILLPDWLRGNNKIKATREGDTLFVRPRREEG